MYLMTHVYVTSEQILHYDPCFVNRILFLEEARASCYQDPLCSDRQRPRIDTKMPNTRDDE